MLPPSSGLCLLLAFCFLAYSCTLKMEATWYSKMSVNFQRTTRRCIPEDGTQPALQMWPQKSCPLHTVALVLNASVYSFQYFRVINAFSSLGHDGYKFMIKLSKITMKLQFPSVLSPMFNYSCFKYCILISSVPQNMEIRRIIKSRSQWPRGIGHEMSSLAWTLGSWVRIPLEPWMFVCVYSVCIVLCR
jgi:hypothetical protein